MILLAAAIVQDVSKPFAAAMTDVAADGGGTGGKKFPVRATVLATAAWCVLLVAVLSQPRTAACTQLYTNTFAVRLHGPGRDSAGHVDEMVAHQVAKRAGSGFENVGKVHTCICVYNNIIKYILFILFGIR